MNNDKEYLVQFLSSLSMLSLFTYIPLWGYTLGLTKPEIAISSLFYGVAVLFTNLISGRVSDRIGARKPFVVIGLFITGASALILILPHGFLEFVIVRAIVGIGIGVYVPTLTALVHDKGIKLGRFSSMGTLAWAIGIVISGILGIFYIELIFVFVMLTVTGAGVVALFVKEGKTVEKKYKENTIRVFWQRKRILLAFTIRHSLATSIWVLWPIYLTTLGADTFSIAIIQVLNPITASFLMKKYTDKLPSPLMVNMGLLLSGITFLSYLLATDQYTILPSQMILGSSWAFLYVGTLRYAIEYSDFDKSTVSGWINSIQSISVIIGSILAFVITELGGTIPDIILLAGIGTIICFIFNFGWERIKSSTPI